MASKSKKMLKDKLFAILLPLLIFAIILSATLNFFTASTALNEQTKNNLITTSVLSADQIEQDLKYYQKRMHRFLSNVKLLGSSTTPATINKYFATNTKEIVAVKTFTLTKNKLSPAGFSLLLRKNDPRLEGKKPSTVGKFTQKMTPVINKKAKLQFQNPDPFKKLSLPLANISYRYRNRVIVLTIWQTSFAKHLGLHKGKSGLLVSQDGTVVAASNKKMFFDSNKITSSQLFQLAKSDKSRAGFGDQHTFSSYETMSAAYTKIPNNLLVFSQQNNEVSTILLSRTGVNILILLALFAPLAFLIANNGTKRVRTNINELKNIIKKIAAGDFTHLTRPESSDEIGDLGKHLIYMANQLQGAIKSAVIESRAEKELDISKAVSKTLFPKNDINHENFQVAGFYHSAPKCSGDLWGHHHLQGNKELLYIGDAMGYGASAAISAAIATTALSTIVEDPELQSKDQSTQTTQIIERLNRAIYNLNDGKISMTLFLAILDFNTGKMTFTNAGHNFPILISSKKDSLKRGHPLKIIKSSDKHHQDIEAVTLKTKGSPLGIESDTSYACDEVILLPNDKLFLYTDGLTQCKSSKGKSWGQRAMVDSVLKHANQTHIDLKDRVIESAFKYFGNQKTKDDVTVVVAQVSEQWTSPNTSMEINQIEISAIESPEENDKAQTINLGLPSAPPEPVQQVLNNPPLPPTPAKISEDTAIAPAGILSSPKPDELFEAPEKSDENILILEEKSGKKVG